MEQEFIDGIEIPRLMIGTSPFIGAGQFGPKAQEYSIRFFAHPENITELIVEAVKLGITCVQALPYLPIVNAIEDAKSRTGKDIQIVAALGAKDFDQELELMRNLGARIFLTHAVVTDKLDDRFNRCINRIDEAGIAGVATHNPGAVIPQLRNHEKVKIVMAPINKTGRFMNPSQETTLEAIRNTDKIVIGKKTLAAGLLKPKEALEYTKEFAYGVAIGITSSEELQETFGIAKELWNT